MNNFEEPTYTHHDEFMVVWSGGEVDCFDSHDDLAEHVEHMRDNTPDHEWVPPLAVLKRTITTSVETSSWAPVGTIVR